MNIDKIKVFKVGECDWIAGLDKESVKNWYEKEIDDKIEIIEEVTDLENDGVWFECELSDIIKELETNKNKEVRIMRTKYVYCIWNSFKDLIRAEYGEVDEDKFEIQIIASTEC